MTVADTACHFGFGLQSGNDYVASGAVPAAHVVSGLRKWRCAVLAGSAASILRDGHCEPGSPSVGAQTSHRGNGI
eukprot:SAG11_NODE_10708_length_810_cov_1.658228_1_plen_75_part_00